MPNTPLRGKTVLITAGPTREPLDPVRFLSNASTGAMGLAVARAALLRGAAVQLVLGPTPLAVPPKARVTRIETAREMHRAVKARLPRADIFIATAAVSDFRASAPRRGKMKKGARRTLHVTLVRNPDILLEASLWRKKRDRTGARAVGGRRPLLVGFALETGAVPREAAAKRARKDLDLVIGNTPRTFGRAGIRPYWLERQARGRWLAPMAKERLARRIVDWAVLELNRGARHA